MKYDVTKSELYLSQILLKDLSPMELKVLLAWSIDSRDSNFSASTTELAERYSWHQPQISNAFKRLVEKRILTRLPKTKNIQMYEWHPKFIERVESVTLKTMYVNKPARKKRATGTNDFKVQNDAKAADEIQIDKNIREMLLKSRLKRSKTLKSTPEIKSPQIAKPQSPIQPKRADGEVFRGEDGRILIVSGERINRAGDEDIIAFMDNEGGHSEYEIFLKIREPLHLKNPDYIKRFKKMRREDD